MRPTIVGMGGVRIFKNSLTVFFSWRENPQSRLQYVEVYRTNGLMLARWLSSGKESDFEGEEVHGYLPTPSEVPVSEIGDEFLTPRQLFDWATTSISTNTFEYWLERTTRAGFSNNSRHTKLHTLIFTNLYTDTDTVVLQSEDENKLSRDWMPPENILWFVTCLHEQLVLKVRSLIK